MEQGQELKNKAAKGFLWGGLNNGMVQLMGAVFGIFLLRMLHPSDYGKITVLMVFSGLATVIQESGFTAALCNLKEPRHEDYNAVFWSNVGLGTLLYVILFFAAPWIGCIYDDPSLVPLSRYLFLGFFISSLGTVQRAYLFIHLMNKQTCLIAVVSLFVSSSVAVFMAWQGCAAWALATQNVLFILVVALMNWYYSPWRPTLHINLSPVVRMLPFSSKLLFSGIINSLSSNAFGFLLGYYYTDHKAGIYGTARKWDDMCANTINGMLTGVAQPILSRVRADRERYRHVFRKMLRFVSFISFPSLLGMGLIAREFLLVVAGPRWVESAELLSLLSIYGAVFPLQTLYGQMTVSQGKSSINMWCTLCLSVLVLAGLVCLHPYGLRVMLVYFVVLNVSWLFVWQYFAYRLIGLSFRCALADVLPFCFLSLFVMTVTWWVTKDITNIYLLLVSRILVAATLYVSILWASGASILRESVRYVFYKKNSEAA